MNKQICSLTILILVTFLGFNANAQQLYIGARIGANLANQSDNSLRTGFSDAINSGLLIGAEIDIPFDKTWSLSLQALYDQKGTNQNLNQALFTTEQSPDAMIGTGTFKINFNYFEVPVLLEATWGGGEIRPYVFAGPSFGIFLNGSSSINVASTSGGATETITSYQSVSTASVKSPDISAVLGAGLSFTISSGQLLFIDAAYALGLVNVANTSNGDNSTVKSRDIRLAVGILFPLN